MCFTLHDIAGSYKVRGILNQLRHFRRSHVTPTERPLVTLSAGNYGKAFAYLTSDFQRRLVLMPTTSPDNRQAVIEVLSHENIFNENAQNERHNLTRRNVRNLTKSGRI